MIVNINLFYLAKPKYGGWVTYTTHLFRALQEVGCQVSLFKITKRTESSVRHFSDGIYYQNVDIETAETLSKMMPSVITASDKNYLHETESILSNEAHIVIHDPTEMREQLVDVVKKTKCKPISIREVNVKNLKTLGLDSVFVRHPYVRYNKEGSVQDKTELAVSTSRIDFDKHIDTILDANNSLKDKVKIYGAENGLYTYHKLIKTHPEWKQDYHGCFGNAYGEVFKILNPSKYMIDMSAIKKDGGGTQYTFLEGWDANCVLILNKKWDIGVGNDMQENVNCLYAETSDDLVNILKRDTDDFGHLIESGLQRLELHTPEVIAKDFIGVING